MDIERVLGIIEELENHAGVDSQIAQMLEEVQQCVEEQQQEIERLKDILIKYENCTVCKCNSECDNENKSSIHVCYMWQPLPDVQRREV